MYRWSCHWMWGLLLAGIESVSVAAEQPAGPVPTNGTIQGEWSFKAGAELDADGRPVAASKPTWSWGIAISGSFRVTWGERPADTLPHVDLAELSKLENRLMELTNAERKKAGKPLLKADPVLMTVARKQSAHMAKLKQISHELEGRTLSVRLNEVGYKALAAGENCAEGAESPEEAISDWLMSEGHKGAMLNERYTRLGVGIATDADGRHYYTQVFASPFEGRPATPPAK